MSRSPSVGSTRNPRFTPSDQDVAIHRVFTEATAPLTTDDVAEQSKAALTTVRHTLKWWSEHGLLRRTFVGRRAFYEWSPSESGNEYAQLLDAAATLRSIRPAGESQPVQVASPAVAQVMRALARLIESVADLIEQQR